MRYLIGLRLCICCFLMSMAMNTQAQESNTPEEQTILKIIYTVDGYWQAVNPLHEEASWDNSVFHIGNMEVYFLTRNDAFRRYSEAWAEENGWKGAKSDDKANWKYGNDGTDNSVLSGDWQACFRTYADLYAVNPDEKKIARVKDVIEYQMKTPVYEYWGTARDLYTAMPVMSKLYKITGDKSYLSKLLQYLAYTDSLLYDPKSKLYYKNSGAVYPEHKSISGKKDFGSLENGWAFAGFAKLLSDLSKKDSCRNDYLNRFRNMADAIVRSQHPDGYWNYSMLDSLQTPGPEVAGTALLTYGLLWGINNDVLDAKIFLPAALRGWGFLVTVALQTDGRIGYIRSVKDPDQAIDEKSSANYGVGAFLLAACEAFRFFQDVNND